MATPHLCSHCNTRSIETVVRVPCVRGRPFARAVRIQTVMGCTACVRRAISQELGRSALLGWWSLRGLLLNPILLTVTVVRRARVRADPAAVSRSLEQAGVPREGVEADPVRVACALAVAMIAADGKIEPEEVAVALEVGQQLFAGFTAEVLSAVLANHKHLPTVTELASLLAPLLDEPEKAQVFDYLAEIAASDGEVAAAEAELLEQVRLSLGLSQASALRVGPV